jgi:hypothetical protein
LQAKLKEANALKVLIFSSIFWRRKFALHDKNFNFMLHDYLQKKKKIRKNLIILIFTSTDIISEKG